MTRFLCAACLSCRRRRPGQRLPGAMPSTAISTDSGYDRVALRDSHRSRGDLAGYARFVPRASRESATTAFTITASPSSCHAARTALPPRRSRLIHAPPRFRLRSERFPASCWLLRSDSLSNNPTGLEALPLHAGPPPKLIRALTSWYPAYWRPTVCQVSLVKWTIIIHVGPVRHSVT